MRVSVCVCVCVCAGEGVGRQVDRLLHVPPNTRTLSERLFQECGLLNNGHRTKNQQNIHCAGIL